MFSQFCYYCQYIPAAPSRQAALERQDLSCTYLAHHELQSVIIISSIIIIGIISSIMIIIDFTQLMRHSMQASLSFACR